MNRFLKVSVVSCLALAMAIGAASAEEQQKKKRRLGFFEQLFGVSQSGDQPFYEQPFFDRSTRRFDSFASGDERGGVRFLRDARKIRADASADAEGDPEADPGFGMGNLTYVAPKLVPLSGLLPAGDRPARAEAAAIYDQLAGSGASLRVLPQARDAILGQYAARGYTPLWLDGARLSARGEAVLKLLAAAGAEGLEPQSYLPTGLSSFDAPLPADDAGALARLDIDLSAAALRYAHDASGGQFDPGLLSRYHDVTPPWIDPAEAMKVIAWSPFAADYLRGLNPTHPAYRAMKEALAELRAAPGAEAAPIADGKIVKVGGEDPRLPEVRRRLAALGYQGKPGAEQPEVLDAALSAELRKFQQASAIKVSGALGPQTVAALNGGGGKARIDALLDNIERLRWLPRQLGRRHVFVNQAAFTAEVVEDGKAVWTTRVIVGKPTTQTAVFNDEMEMVVFNPSWGVPPSIIANEYLPKLRRDSAYLDKLGFKVLTPEGKVVASRAIDWASYGNKVPFAIQQPPGEKNALGEIKFLFPNSHNIYMHDTPMRELFAQDVRAFSHGCVRVQNPREFASVVLGWPEERVASHLKTPESETVRLKAKLPVYLTYFTAWPDAAGRMRYYADIYGRDQAMETARTAVLLAQR